MTLFKYGGLCPGRIGAGGLELRPGHPGGQATLVLTTGKSMGVSNASLR